MSCRRGFFGAIPVSAFSLPSSKGALSGCRFFLAGTSGSGVLALRASIVIPPIFKLCAHVRHLISIYFNNILECKQNDFKTPFPIWGRCSDR